jgi:hypothetical protein
MSDELPIGFSFKWRQSDGDASICMSCNEPIYGKKYTPTMSVKVGTEVDKIPLPDGCCEACYEAKYKIE